MNLPVFFTFLIFFIAALGLRWLSKDCEKINNKLKEFKARVRPCYDLEELQIIRKELIAFNNKKCWHVIQGEAARSILLAIDFKISTIKALTKNKDETL